MNRVIVLMYHIIAHPLSLQESRYCCAPERFEVHMRHLAQSHLQVVSLDAIADAMDGRTDWPANGVAVTFDDGFAHTCTNAMPVLARYKIPATMFALSGHVGGTNRWMSERGFPERPLMSAQQLRDMAAAGIGIGSHTRTHPHLPALDAVTKRDEIRGSKQDLEDLLGRAVTSFAYPYGHLDGDARLAVEEAGYRSACSVRTGFNGPGVDRFLLRRIEVFGTDSVRQLRQKLRFGANDVSALYPIRYYAGRVASRLGF